MKSWHLLVVCAAMAAAGTIVPRDDAECAANPSFSCPSGSNCIPTTDDNSSVICCPPNATCKLIQPVNCDIQQQNATQFPTNLLHTSNLDATLQQCGAQCCPMGYVCQGGMCVMTKANPTTSPAAAAPTVTRPAATGLAAVPAQDPVSSGSSTSHKTAIAVGVTFGILAFAILALLLLWCLKRRRRNSKTTYTDPEPKRKHGRHHHKSKNTRHHSDEFMGTTPRPLDHHHEAAMSPAGVALGRSASSHHKPQKSMTSTVSEPMWNPTFSGGAPLHRTDFLLRRGSVETGFEGKVKPSWSTRSKNRPKSRLRSNTRSRTLPTSATEEPNTNTATPSNTLPSNPRPKSRLNPLFATPLRFGLPTTPKPANRTDNTNDNANHNGTTTQTPHPRPPRSDENLARLVAVGGKTVPSGAAVRVNNTTPPPSRAQKYTMPARQRDRSESQRRPLVRDDSVRQRHDEDHEAASAEHEMAERPRGRPGALVAQAGPAGAAPPPVPARSRASSSASTATFESGSSDLEKYAHTHSESGAQRPSYLPQQQLGNKTPKHDPSASSETINVLLPPPSVFQTPPPVARRDGRGRERDDVMMGPGGVRRETTFEELMREAGWRSSQWGGR